MKVNMFDDSSSHRLVGKFFTDSTPPSFDETEQSLRKQWILTGDMTIQKQGNSDKFLFEFEQKKDKEKVLENGHYNVNGVIIVIKDLNSYNMIDFTVASFLVAVMGLPNYLCTDDFLSTLKSRVGDNDPVLYGQPNILGRFYFRVDIDLKKPLRPGFYIDDNQNRFVEFKYQNLGDFCYSCGMIGHVKGNCDKVKFPKERALNATSRTHVYGPWLRYSPLETSYQLELMKSPNGVGECEETLSYPQVFIEIEFNCVLVCNTRLGRETNSTHRFRFPCSYLDTETESTDFITTSKAYEVIRREIYENSPFSLGGLEHKSLNIPDVFASLVEQLKVIKKDERYCDDKWLTLTLQVNKKYVLTPVDYEMLSAVYRELSIENKMASLIKKRVENNENLVSLSSWEDQIRETISEMGFTHYMHHSYVSRRANKAMIEAVWMEISSSSSTIPADKSAVSGLERSKVLGPDMDRLDPCVICTEEMFLAEETTILPCSHVFHSSCVDKWFQFGHKCPLCGFMLPSQK